MNTSLVNPTSLAPILDFAIQNNGSDIHFVANSSPMVRIDTQLRPMEFPVFTPESVTTMLSSFLGSELSQKIATTREELDFSMTYQTVRFRCNVYLERGSLAASLRILPTSIPDMGSLGLPDVTHKMLEHNQGLILVVGPTGHGKSTSLAAMLNTVLQERRWHLITLEDPIEFLFDHHKGLVSQREIGSDSPSFASALRTILREDPDVVYMGEMRDKDSVDAALQLAQTGHLVLSTLHTNSAAQAPDRIVDMFPPHDQDRVRFQLSETLIGIQSQRLLPRIQGGRVLVSEVMLANPAVRSLIRERKTHQLPNLIQTSAAEGMMNMDRSLADQVVKGVISIDEALGWASDPQALKLMIY